MPAADLPSALVGRWAVERDLRDLRAGRVGHFRGTATKTCAGMALARAEVTDVFRTLLASIDNPRLDPDMYLARAERAET